MGGRRATRFAVILPAVVVAAVGLVARARANVNLELRTSPSVFRVGAVISVGLYAVSDSIQDQPFFGLDVVLFWDPSAVELLGHVDNGPFPWTPAGLSGFLNERLVSGLNADCGTDLYCDPFTGVPFNDGDALYTASLVFPGTQPIATPSGLLVTTLQFRALTAGAATTIEIGPSEPECKGTRVVGSDGEQTFCLTGRLRPVTVVVAACGFGGDVDGDCEIRLADYATFPSCLMGPDVATPCPAADIDGDLDSDLRDFSFLQSSYSGL